MPVQSHSPSTLTNQSTNQPVKQASKQAPFTANSLPPFQHLISQAKDGVSKAISGEQKAIPPLVQNKVFHKQLYLYPSSCTSSVVVVVAAARPIFPMSSAVFMFSIWISTSLPAPCIPCVSSAFPPPSMAVQKLPIRRPSCKSDKSV